VCVYLSELGVWISEFVDCLWRVVVVVHGVIGMGNSNEVDWKNGWYM
jgi:hypothetical protein